MDVASGTESELKSRSVGRRGAARDACVRAARTDGSVDDDAPPPRGGGGGDRVPCGRRTRVVVAWQRRTRLAAGRGGACVAPRLGRRGGKREAYAQWRRDDVGQVGDNECFVFGWIFFFFGRGVLGGFCWFSRLRRSHQDPKTQFSREQEDFM